MAEETLDDRLSQLPDCLLLKILSLLPTEEAFTTCILSKRWQYLWTSLDTFVFSPRSSWGRSKGFRSFVNYVLYHSTASKITKFEIHCSRLYKYKSQTITLEEMVVVDAQINNLLSGCPALETIVFCKVGGFRRLEINSLKVKSLKLEGYWVDDGDASDHSFEIFAPYIQYLELSHYFHDFKCSLVDVSSVVSAKITFDITCIKDLQDDPDLDSDEEEEDSCSDYHQGVKTVVHGYLQKLRRATKLTFGTLLTLVVCILQFKEVPIPELDRKHLALELHVEKFNLYGAAGLWRATPLVETLNIEIENQPFDDSRCYFERKYLVKGDNIGLQSYISSFVLSNLKNVKIIISSGMCMKEHLKWEYIKKLFRLSNFLLDKAVILEKFVIVSNSRRCEMCGIKCVSRFLLRLANKLRSSANSVIIFQDFGTHFVGLLEADKPLQASEHAFSRSAGLVDVSSVDNAKDNPDEDSDEEDSCSEDHQDSDDEEDSFGDYYYCCQDSDDEEEDQQ